MAGMDDNNQDCDCGDHAFEHFTAILHESPSDETPAECNCYEVECANGTKVAIPPGAVIRFQMAPYPIGDYKLVIDSYDPNTKTGYGVWISAEDFAKKFPPAP